MVLMVQGDLMAITLAHVLIATKTGLLAVVPALGVTFTKQVRHLLNRSTRPQYFSVSARSFRGRRGSRIALSGRVHRSGPHGHGAFFFSLAVSYTPIGKKIDHLAETFVRR